MTTPSAIVTTSEASRIAHATLRTTIVPNYATDRDELVWLKILERNKKEQDFTQDGIEIVLKKNGGITFQTWGGSDSLTHQKPNIGYSLVYRYYNGFTGIEVQHDEMKKLGITMKPNTFNVDRKATPMGKGTYTKVYNYFKQMMEAKHWEFRKGNNDKLLLQGSTSRDPLGLNGILPINPYSGSVGEVDRSTNALVRHLVTVGATSVASGTLRSSMQTMWRNLGKKCHGMGVPGRTDVIMAGSAALDAYDAYAFNNGGRFDSEMDNKSRNIDLGIADRSFKGIPIIYNPALDEMDSSASSEQGLPYAPSIAVGFSGGAGSGAAAVAYVESGGTITGIAITNPGTGYTSAPTLAITGGGGSGATATCTVYSASSGAGLTQVDSDDDRIGQIASITVTGAGTGFTVPTVVPFTNRFYFLNSHVWRYLNQPGIDEEISSPADPYNQRVSYIHCDGTYILACGAPNVQGIVAVA